MRLGFIGRRHLKIRQRANYRPAGSIEKRLVVGAVIDEKFFILVSGAEMAPQQRQYPVLRLDLSAQNAAQLGKADKALQQMGLTVEVPHGGKDRMQRFVGRISQKAGPSRSSLTVKR